MMMNMDIFQLFFNYLEERPYSNIYQNMKQDADYLEATAKETELTQSAIQRIGFIGRTEKIIIQWTDAIQAQESAYTAVGFRLGMQCCFSLLMELAISFANPYSTQLHLF